MATDSSVPFARLYVLPLGASLQLEASGGIKQMKMHYGVKQHAPAVTLSACGPPYDIAFGVDKRKEFLTVVTVHFAASTAAPRPPI